MIECHNPKQVTDPFSQMSAAKVAYTGLRAQAVVVTLGDCHQAQRSRSPSNSFRMSAEAGGDSDPGSFWSQRAIVGCHIGKSKQAAVRVLSIKPIGVPSGRLVHVVFGDRTGYRIPEVRIERRVEGFAVHDHGPDLARGADVGEGIAVDQNDVCKRVDQARGSAVRPSALMTAAPSSPNPGHGTSR